MSSPVETIKERLGIVEVVESYLKLEKAGGSFKGKCPFHNEKTPSFFVSPDRGTFYCFGCGAKGDIFSFVEQFEGTDFRGALKTLAARAGVTIEYEDKAVRDEKARLHTIMEEATLFYNRELAAHPAAAQYLQSRGVLEQTQREFRLGYAPLEWRALHAYLKTKGYSDLEIEKVGLAKKSDEPGRSDTYYDRFRGRIMFPINDIGGRVIGFSGRILVDDGKSAKYLNSPDTVLFNKSHILYGLDRAKLEIRKRDYTILVEGQMDLVMSHQAGFLNTVASSGTALTDNLFSRDNVVNALGVVKRLSNNLMLALDSDAAGLKAASRAAAIALSLGMDVKVASIPGGKDPADVILRNKDEWRESLKNSKHVIDFHLQMIIDSVKDPRKRPKEIKERVLPFVAELQGNMERAHFVKKIGESLGVSEDAVWKDLETMPKKVMGSVENTSSNKDTVDQGDTRRSRSIERKVVALVSWQEGLKEKNIDHGAFIAEVERILGKEKWMKILEFFSAQKNELIFEAEISYQNSEKLQQDVKEILFNLEEESLKDEFADIMGQLAIAERQKDESGSLSLIKRCQEVSEKIAALKKKGMG
jgi:DNA primase